MSKKNKKQFLKDNSPKVSQRPKISNEFIINEFKWTDKQKQLIELALNKKNQIIFIKAPPGVGKTLVSVFCCLNLLNNKLISEILFLRNPVESASHSLGFLTGDKSDKISVYATPLYDHLRELINKSTQDSLIKETRIKVDSIGFIKGCTWNTTGIICDEAEDLNIKELRLVLGRLGKFSKLFIIGDEQQSNTRDSGFVKVFNLFNNQESKDQGIITYEFTLADCMRNGLMKFILEKLGNI